MTSAMTEVTQLTSAYTRSMLDGAGVLPSGKGSIGAGLLLGDHRRPLTEQLALALRARVFHGTKHAA